MKNRSPILMGLLCGIGTVLFLLLCYFIDKSLSYNPVVIYATWLPFIICMGLAIVLEKSKIKVSYKWALRTAFLCYIISAAIYYFYDFIMKKYVDPGLVDMMEVAYLEELSSYLPNQQANNVDFTPMFSDYFYNFASSLIVGFIISAILAYILKDE